MLLTGKTKEDFRKWFDENYFNDCNYYQIKPIILNALIIEWFDSVNIKISITYSNAFKGFDFLLDSEHYKVNSGTHTRQEATKQAIEKANEIYNNLNL